MEDLDFPPHGIPLDFFDRVRADRTGRSVISFQSIFLRFFGAPRSEAWITVRNRAEYRFCLPIGGRHANFPVSDLQNDFVWIAITVSGLDAMQPLDGNLIHFVSDGVIPIAGKAVSPPHRCGSRSWGPDLLGQNTEKFVDVALTVSDMHASPRIIREGPVDCRRFSNHRMLSFCSIGTRVGLIFVLSAAVPLNFLRVQNLIAASPNGKPFGRDRQARMHHDTADCVRTADDLPCPTHY